MTRRNLAIVLLGAAAIAVVAEAVGTKFIDLGPGQVILFPIVWAILIGGLISFQRVKPLPREAQRDALELVSVGIMVFLVLVGITVGASLTVLREVTWALALQEFMQLFGTVVVALPIAIALRMGRASIGATYSIDREANLAYTAERYGPSSPEYRGTLGVYVFGSVFGALYLALIAGYVSSAGWLDPLALAMGSGVGSGSMMAAASGAIASAHPDLENQILAFAAASNLMTQTIGTFVTCFIALPLAERLYPMWCRAFGVAQRLEIDGDVRETDGPASSGGGTGPSTTMTAVAQGAEVVVRPRIGLARLAQILAVFVALMSLSNAVGTRSFELDAVLAIAGMGLVTFGAFALNRAVPRIPVLVTTVVVGMLVAAPFSPISDRVVELVAGITFLSLVTPVLALVGLSLGAEREALKNLSWRVVLVALVSFSVAFLLAAASAQLFL
ncbi:DUF3100 domain-containing protein [Nocardioides sp. L-11A]|uniref:DUF3100 domain-containing protein n=1 Tax=Nocardioides sp. L-11A TaxID=3043848 RepID=UPI00249B1CD6|nr:DUF3100 domain-containing protein [Nocardioides sp. L-11A]